MVSSYTYLYMKQIRTQYEKIVTYLTDENRKNWLFIISALGLLASLYMTESAWTASRTYPLIPIVPEMRLSTTIQVSLFIVVLSTFLWSVFSVHLHKKLVTLGLVSLLILVLLDITRLQPWIFHYVTILLFFSLLIPRRFVTTPYLLDTTRIIIGGIYFWSGVQKFNIRFFTEIFPWFTEKIWLPFGNSGATIAITVGLFVPFIEALFAIGFFTKRFRNSSLFGATTMIVLVLICLGPWGQNWNSSVWPWNIAIYSMVIVLFLGLPTTLTEFVNRQKHNVIGWVAFFIFWLMPLGNIDGFVDHYLSWSLYSGRVPEATLIGDQLTLESLSSQAANNQLEFVHWTQADINMVPYPEERIFINVFKKICQNEIYRNIILQIHSPYWFSSQYHKETLLKCTDIE